VKIPAKRLNAQTLAGDWAREFSRALHRALAYPDGEGASAVQRYQSQAEYNAALLQYLLTERVSPTWQFPELEEWRGCGAAQAAHEFVLRKPEYLTETISQLAQIGWLDPLLGLWDELRMEQLIQAIAKTEAAGAVKIASAGLTLESLIALGQAAATGGLHPQWSMASRRQAVRLWSRLSQRFSLRLVWHGLRLLLRLLEQPSLLVSADAALLSDPIPFPQWCAAIVKEAAAKRNLAAPHYACSVLSSLDAVLSGLRPLVPSTANPHQTANLLKEAAAKRNFAVPYYACSVVSDLDAVLSDLRPLVSSAASPNQAAKWVSSDNCGVLLLISIVRRLDLWRLVYKPEFVEFGGPRAISFLLAAIGMTLLGEWTPEHPVDQAVALFAGILSEIDRTGLKQFFAEADVQAISDLDRAKTWPEALENLAIELARSFAQRVRGFKQTSREAVVRQFIRVPGRVLVEERRLMVVLGPSPWSVALHISGMDQPLESIEWLGGRRVEFVLEGL
jgi:hypothetical protein